MKYKVMCLTKDGGIKTITPDPKTEEDAKQSVEFWGSLAQIQFCEILEIEEEEEA